jgi:hypothetical protein
MAELRPRLTRLQRAFDTAQRENSADRIDIYFVNSIWLRPDIWGGEYLTGLALTPAAYPRRGASSTPRRRGFSSRPGRIQTTSPPTQ